MEIMRLLMVEEVVVVGKVVVEGEALAGAAVVVVAVVVAVAVKAEAEAAVAVEVVKRAVTREEVAAEARAVVDVEAVVAAAVEVALRVEAPAETINVGDKNEAGGRFIFLLRLVFKLFHELLFNLFQFLG